MDVQIFITLHITYEIGEIPMLEGIKGMK